MTTRTLSQSRLKELFHYCPDTGDFTRLVSTNGRVKAGDIAGCLNNYGYLRITIDWESYLNNRLAFLYMTGAFPRYNTDHINGIRDDNRWVNLRDVTQAENNRNMKKPNTNTSGITGVHWNKNNNNWRARIRAGGKHTDLGSYTDFFEACCARKSAELKYDYHPNHGR